jgi:hypothetical protein
MWIAVTFAAIAVMGTAFLVWFLLGLLRQRGPSVCYWIVPARRRPQKERHLEALRRIYADKDCRAPQGKRSDYCVELLENASHAKKGASGLIVLDVRLVSASLGWRSIQPSRVNAFHDRRLWFGGTNRKAGNAG